MLFAGTISRKEETKFPKMKFAFGQNGFSQKKFDQKSLFGRKTCGRNIPPHYNNYNNKNNYNKSNYKLPCALLTVVLSLSLPLLRLVSSFSLLIIQLLLH